MQNSRKLKESLIIIVGIFGLLLFIAVMYFSVTDNSSSDQQNQLRSDNDTLNSDVDTMVSKVRMEMPKNEVNKAIGNPYQCTKSKLPAGQDIRYTMEHCQYGSKAAEYHLNVTYMNGKVWGTGSVKNSN